MPREIIFEVFVQALNLQFSRIGSIWCEVGLDEETANKLIAKFGNRVYKMY